MMNNQTAEDMQNNVPQESPEEADNQMLSAKFRVAGYVVLFIAAVFIINAMDRETPITQTYKAVMFFVGSDIVRVIILVMFPAITLFLLPG